MNTTNNTKIWITGMVAFGLLLLSNFTFAQTNDSNSSLGLKNVSDFNNLTKQPIPPVNSSWVTDNQPIARNFTGQPPLVPHTVQRYQINLQKNDCLGCHSWAKAAQKEATKFGLSHFKDRDGVEHSSLAANHYFCNQCHVAQKNAKPLMKNNFEPTSEFNKTEE